MTRTQAAIAADSPFTAEAGARIAREGGNAVDIAVAAALTATVAEPLMCSLGGAGFFMVRPAGHAPELIEGADMAPTIDDPPKGESAAWRTARLPYGDGIDVKAGHAAVAVPGMPAAAEAAWKRHGRLPWREVVRPALELSRRAIPTDATLAKWLALVGKALFWQQEAYRHCLFPEGKCLEQGATYRLPHMDQTLEAIAEQGARDLYEGDLAAAFAREMQANGGFITREDLAAYQARVRQPLSLESRGFQLALNPPPAVGGAAVGALVSLFQSSWEESMSPAAQALLQAQSQQRVLQMRQGQFRQPDFDHDAAYALLAEPGGKAALKSPNTTHLSVVTGDGSMVAVTMSMGYGSGVLIPDLGIGCNNSLGEPELNPLGFHQTAPGTRLVSNMAPTLAWRGDGWALAFGSPGASRITTSIAQTWDRFACEGMSLTAAVEAPRLHLEPFDEGLRAQFEPGIDTSLLPGDFILRPFEEQNMYFGAIKLAARDASGQLHAVADERRHGATEIVNAD